jgi:hypothetical protein
VAVDKWQHFINSNASMTMFNVGPEAVTADSNPGDTGYRKRNFGRYVENTGTDNLAFKEIFKTDAPEYSPRARTAHARLRCLYACSPRRGPASGGCPNASPLAAPYQQARTVLCALRRHSVFRHDWHVLSTLYAAEANRDFIVVDIARERLYLFVSGRLRASWPISTSLRGIGQRSGSLRTPVGVFRVVGKIGAGQPGHEIIRGEMETGQIASLVSAPDDPAASATIVGRILTLEGLEPGWNAGGAVDTYDRHIYIHGTANIGMLGRPASDGCVQMAPHAVARLFASIQRGALVMITPGKHLGTIPGLSASPPPALVADATGGAPSEASPRFFVASGATDQADRGVDHGRKTGG